MENSAPFRRNTIFLLGDFRENSHLAPNTHAPHKTQVWLCSACYRDLPEQRCAFLAVSWLLLEIFPENTILQCTRMGHKRCKFGYWSLIQDTFLRECAILAVHRLQLEGLFCKCKPLILHARIQRKVWLRSVTFGHMLGEQIISLAACGFPLEGFPRKLVPCPVLALLHMVRVSLLSVAKQWHFTRRITFFFGRSRLPLE